MKYILHIDTSAEPGMAALSSEGRVLAQRQIAESRQQASLLNVLIEELFTELSLKAKDLSAVAVCAGPGSYTGLRIGMAAAKAFCYVWDLPLLAHNKLTLLAVQMAKFAPQFSAYLPCLNVRENEFFAALYDGDMNELYSL